MPLEKGANRRDFMKLMGASVAMAGLAACRQPDETIVPYVNQPENLIPGKPLFFATAMPLSGVATGVLVESHMHRPTKIEGNPEHPSSLGASDSFMQASVLSLYDPDRSQVVRKLGDTATQEFLQSDVVARLAELEMVDVNGPWWRLRRLMQRTRPLRRTRRIRQQVVNCTQSGRVAVAQAGVGIGKDPRSIDNARLGR